MLAALTTRTGNRRPRGLCSPPSPTPCTWTRADQRLVVRARRAGTGPPRHPAVSPFPSSTWGGAGRPRAAARRGENTLTRRDRRVVDGLLRRPRARRRARSWRCESRPHRRRARGGATQDPPGAARRPRPDPLRHRAERGSTGRTRTGRRRAAPGCRLAVEQSPKTAYGLRPPVLDDHGLVAALHVRVGGPDVPSTRRSTSTSRPRSTSRPFGSSGGRDQPARKHGAAPSASGCGCATACSRLLVSDAGPGLPRTCARASA